MSRRRRAKADVSALAADPGPEDGVDPRDRSARRWEAPNPHGRKVLQLCSQVRDALQSILPGCGDEVLQALTVVSVDPAPHAGRLRVVVAGPPDTRRAVVRDHLGRAAGMLRQEVAARVHRRKAPELAFEV